MGEVVECLLRRLGITHLRTSAYHLQTDAKCERVHFSVHNIITKLIDDKHERWPDLLGAVALAYNATVHTATGYSPHELFYFFAPSCPLDALVSTPASDSVSSADEYALQAFEHLQEATAFISTYTGKQMQRMKCYYDSSVRPVSYAEGEKVLVYNLRKQRGKFAKWQVCWHGPVTVQHKLNDSNYVLLKGKGKAVVVHVDRMRKLPNSPDAELSGLHTHTKHNETTIPLYKRRRTQPATYELPSIHPTDSSSRADRADRLLPVVKTTDTSQATNVCTPSDLDTCRLRKQASQSTDPVAETGVVTTGQADKPHPGHTGCPSRSHRKPIRFLDNIEASVLLIGRVGSRLSIVFRITCFRLGSACDRSGVVEKRCVVEDCSKVVGSVVKSGCRMPRCRHFSQPDAEGWRTVGMGSGVGEAPETHARPAWRSVGPLAVLMDTDDRQGVSVGGPGPSDQAAAGGDGGPAVSSQSADAAAAVSSSTGEPAEPQGPAMVHPARLKPPGLCYLHKTS